MEADIYVYAPDLTVADGTVTPAKFASSVYGLVGEIAALGSVSAGSSVRLSRADHVHPTTGLAVLGSANTFTAAQTITPTTGVAATVNGVSGAVSLIVNGASGNTADLQQWQGNGTVFSSFDQFGRLRVRSTNTSAFSAVIEAASAATVPLLTKGIASQTADLQQWQTSAATVASVSSSGQFSISPSSGTALTITPASGQFSQIWRDSSNNTPTRMNEFAQLGIRTFGGVYNSASLSVNTNFDGGSGIVIRGNSATQSADLQQWQNSGTTVLAKIDSAGALSLSPTSGTALTVNAAIGATAAVGLVVKANTTAGSGNDIAQFYHQNGGLYSGINNAGQLGLRTQTSGSTITTYSATLGVGTQNDTVFGIVIRGNATSGTATQTADSFQYQSGATGNAVLGGRNALAQIYSGSTSPVTVATGGAISGTSSGTTATLTSASTHGLAVGDLVTIAGMTPSGYNGTYLVLASPAPTSTTFAVTTSGSNLGNSTVSGTASVPAQASITARSAGTIPWIVRVAANQVADATRWQDSTGGTLAYVNNAGVIRGLILQSSGADFDARTISGGGAVTLFRATSTPSNPGANYARLYFRDGTNANTLKLVVRAGAAGAETTILDNIPT